MAKRKIRSSPLALVSPFGRRGDAKSDSEAVASHRASGVSPSRGLFQDNSTSGQEGSASIEGKHGEKTTNTIDGKPDIASGFL